MARHQSHVAWGNSTSSLPIPLLSSSVEQSSICKAAPAPVGRQSQDGGTFDPQGLAQKRNYFQLTRPAYGNVYEWLSRDWESPPGSHSALGSVKRFDEYPVPSTTSLHLSNNDRTFQSPQEKDLAGRPDHGCSYEAICTPNMVQQGGPRELLPPIDLSDRSSSEDFGPSYKDYSAPGNLQRDALSPTETSCEGLCIFSDDSEHGLSCEDQFQPVRWLSFSSSNGYPGQTLDFTLEGCRITSPRRRLSYGEHLQTPESKSLDGTAGSRELRRALSSVAKTDDYARSKNQTLKGRDTTDRPQTTQPQNEHVPPQHTGSQLIRDNLGKSGSQMESSSTKSTLWSSPDHAHQVDDQFWTYSAPVEGQIKDAVSRLRLAASGTHFAGCTDLCTAIHDSDQPKTSCCHNHTSELLISHKNQNPRAPSRLDITLQSLHTSKNAAPSAKPEAKTQAFAEPTQLPAHATKLTLYNPRMQRNCTTYTDSIV